MSAIRRQVSDDEAMARRMQGSELRNLGAASRGRKDAFQRQGLLERSGPWRALPG